MGGDGIVLKTGIDLSGFTKGSKQLKSAIKSMSNQMTSFGRQTDKMAQNMVRPFKRLLPMILGVSSVYGILSKAVSSYMSQNEQLSQRMTAIWTALGNVIGPIIEQVISWVSTAVSYFLQFLKLIGVTSKSASELSKQTKKNTQELQRTIAGFDELNVLQKPSNGNKENPLEDKEMPDWMKNLIDMVKNKEWDAIADLLIGKLNEVIYKIRDKAYEVGEKIGEYLQGIVHVISRVLNETDWKQLGVGIANFFNGLIKEQEGINFGEDLGKLLVSKITIAFKIVTGFLETLDWKRVAEILTGIVTGAFDALSEAIAGADFRKIGNGIREFFESIDYEEVANSIFNFLKEAWDAAWDLFLGLLGAGTEDESPLVKQFEDIKKAAEDCAAAFIEAMGPVWDDIIKPMLEWSKKSLIPEILNEIKGAFETLTAKLKLFKDTWNGLRDLLFGDSQKGWKELKEATNSYNETMQKTKTPLESFINYLGISIPKSKDFASQLKSSTEQIKTSFSSMSEKIHGVVDDVKQRIQAFKDKISELRNAAKTNVEGIKNTFQGIKDFFANFGPNIQNIFVSIIQAARSWGADMIQNFINGMGDRIGNLWTSMRNIAQGIRDFLGFSEPKKGPLSDFHTYGPDMMELYASGIEGEKGKVFAAVNDVAEGVASVMSGGKFQTPTVAGGGFLPYGIGSQEIAGTSSGEVNGEILTAILQLQELIVRFENSVDNMKWVAQFGEVRAVVQEITKIQKQMGVASGVI